MPSKMHKLKSEKQFTRENSKLISELYKISFLNSFLNFLFRIIFKLNELIGQDAEHTKQRFSLAYTKTFSKCSRCLSNESCPYLIISSILRVFDLLLRVVVEAVSIWSVSTGIRSGA